MQRRTHLRLPALPVTSLIVALILMTAPAFAQHASDPDDVYVAMEDETLAGDLDDPFELSLEALGEVEIITTTARKREESMQETPIAITAFSENRLSDRGRTRPSVVPDAS